MSDRFGSALDSDGVFGKLLVLLRDKTDTSSSAQANQLIWNVSFWNFCTYAEEALILPVHELCWNIITYPTPKILYVPYGQYPNTPEPETKDSVG